MKELIFVMLILCFVALLQINDTIVVEVNLTQGERIQSAEIKAQEVEKRKDYS